MRPFNKSDYELVKDYEKDFTRAINSRYATGLLTEELEAVQKVYNETLNRQANLSCGGCILQMMTSVGRLYLHYKKTVVEAEQKLLEELKAKNESKPKRKRVKKDEVKVEDQAS